MTIKPDPHVLALIDADYEHPLNSPEFKAFARKELKDQVHICIVLLGEALYVFKECEANGISIIETTVYGNEYITWKRLCASLALRLGYLLTGDIEKLYSISWHYLTNNSDLINNAIAHTILLHIASNRNQKLSPSEYACLQHFIRFSEDKYKSLCNRLMSYASLAGYGDPLDDVSYIFDLLAHQKTSTDPARMFAFIRRNPAWVDPEFLEHSIKKIG